MIRVHQRIGIKHRRVGRVQVWIRRVHGGNGGREHITGHARGVHRHVTHAWGVHRDHTPLRVVLMVSLVEGGTLLVHHASTKEKGWNSLCGSCKESKTHTVKHLNIKVAVKQHNYFNEK